MTESRENNNTFAVAFTVPMGTAAAPQPASGVRLEALAPNPVRSATTVAYSLGASGTVRLAVYDVQGREVAVLASGVQTAGAHEITWTPEAAASGVYLVRLDAAGETLMQNVTVVR